MNVNSWLQKLHAMTNIGAINSKHTKSCGVTKIMDFHENL